MEGLDESTELWGHPTDFLIFFNNIDAWKRLSFRLEVPKFDAHKQPKFVFQMSKTKIHFRVPNSTK